MSNINEVHLKLRLHVNLLFGLWPQLVDHWSSTIKNYISSNNCWQMPHFSVFKLPKISFVFCLTKYLQYRPVENWVFLHTLFVENEVQINKNNCRTLFFMSQQVSLPKICWILQKMKISPKSDIRPIAWDPWIIIVKKKN